MLRYDTEKMRARQAVLLQSPPLLEAGRKKVRSQPHCKRQTDPVFLMCSFKVAMSLRQVEA